MAFESARLSVNFPAGIRWAKAHAATPYSFSSRGKELARCVASPSVSSGLLQQESCAHAEERLSDVNRGAESVVEIWRQTCLLHKFVKRRGALFSHSLADLLQPNLAREVPHRNRDHEKHGEKHHIF
jgi:hypothetical protein